MEVMSEVNTHDAGVINICVGQKNGYIHTEAFREIAERIEAESHRNGKIVTITSEEDKSADLNIVLGAHIDPEHISTFESQKLIIINLERLESIKTQVNGTKYFELLNQNSYIDFTSHNALYCNHVGIKLPDYLYRPWHEPRWARVIQQTEKIWDACFVGSMTARREAICKELMQKGVNLKISTSSYSSERDEILGRSKYILNLHAYPNSSAAEIFRLNYYATNKLRCISEICDFEKGEKEISDSITQYPYESFVNGLCRLIKEETVEEYEKSRERLFVASNKFCKIKTSLNRNEEDKPTILNLNCGYDWKEDAINIDTEGGKCEDITLDMSEPWRNINKIQTSKRHGNIHLSENSFDAVIMIGLLETSENPLQLLENTLKLMKPGGWLFIKSSHQDGLEAWANPKAKRAINEEFLAKLQNAGHFAGLESTTLQIKWINFCRGLARNNINIGQEPKIEYIESALVKCIRPDKKRSKESTADTAIKERKTLGMTSSREQLHRKTYLMQGNASNKDISASPSVSLLTPTRGARFPFLKLTWKWINQQSYPKELMEWVILTDTEEEADLLRHQSKELDENIDVRIKIASTGQQVCIGRKRNICNEMADGEILINFDDDDYYFPDRVSHAVEILKRKNNGGYELAGAQELPIYFSTDKSLWISKPGPNLACAGSFAYKKTLLSKTWYSDKARRGEEISFTDNYTIPIASLDPFSTMICIAHRNNTFDKNTMRKRAGCDQGNHIEIGGVRHKGDSKFFCISENIGNQTTQEVWGNEYEQIEELSHNATKDISNISIFEMEQTAESGLAQLALNLHKKFVKG